MSIKLLLAQIIANIMQKVLGTGCNATPDRNIQTEQMHIARLSDDVHDYGCNPIAEVKTIQFLEHGGMYLEVEHQ